MSKSVNLKLQQLPDDSCYKFHYHRANEFLMNENGWKGSSDVFTTQRNRVTSWQTQIEILKHQKCVILYSGYIFKGCFFWASLAKTCCLLFNSFIWTFVRIGCNRVPEIHKKNYLLLTLLSHTWVPVSPPKYFSRNPKRTVHSNMKIQWLCTHSHANGTSGEVSLSSKHCWSFTSKHRCSVLLNNWSRLVLKHEKTVSKKRLNV